MKKTFFIRNRYLFLFILIPIFYFPCYLSNDILIQLTKEDGFYENAGAILFLLSAIAFSFLAAKPHHYQGENRSGRYLERWYFLFFALIFVFAFGEEISWGQRIFNFATPEAIEEANVQGEFNLHNMEFFHGKTAEGEEKTGILSLLEMHKLFYMAFFTYLLIIPIFYDKNQAIKSFIDKIRLPVPSILLGILFTFNLIYGHFMKVLKNDEVERIGHGVVEIKEVVIALILLILPLSWMNFKTKKE